MDAEAEIHIFAIHEETFVEGADAIEHFATHEQARAEEFQDVTTLVRILPRHHRVEFAWHFRSDQETENGIGRSGKLLNPEILDGSVKITNFTSERANLRVIAHF